MRATIDPEAYQAALDQYCVLMHQGAGAKAALKATGLSHAQADLAWYGSELNPNRVVPGSIKLPKVPAKGEDGYEIGLNRLGLIFAELYKGTAKYPEGLSWGYIAVACGVTESYVRRCFTATGLDSKGMRKGRGGRWLGDDPMGYVGNHKAHGIQSARPRAAVTKKFVEEAPTWEPVLPAAVEGLRKQLGGRTGQRARKAVAKKTTAKKAAPKVEQPTS